jgi:NTE family protein
MRNELTHEAIPRKDHPMTKRALVLGGGGPVGIAWETGVIAGLAEAGVDISNADWIMGTSAGSVVGAQLALGHTPAAMMATEVAYALQARAAAPAGAGPAPDLSALMGMMMRRPPSGPMPEELRRDLGQLSLNGKTISEDDFISRFSGLVGDSAVWPVRFACTAVETLTGEFRMWSKDAPALLARAIASSCSVPSIYPAITIGGRRYMDGGMRSGTNADLAKGYDKVLLFAVMPPAFAPFMRPAIEAELAIVRDGGGQTLLAAPDEAFGANLMDGSRRDIIAEAGRVQGMADADRIGEFWS